MVSQEYLQDGRPITLNLILQLHEILMNSVRGQNKSPGEFRKEQNWIGKAGCSIEEASFMKQQKCKSVKLLIHSTQLN